MRGNMEKEELKKRIAELNKSSEYAELAERLLSIPIPWFFVNKYGENAAQKYSEFKLYIANKFGVTANDVCLAGSAWLGYSLSPDQDFSDFNDESDIDIVIVSERNFNLFWDCYLKELITGALHGKTYEWLSKNTFKRFVDYRADEPLSISQSFYISFQKKINGYAKDLQVNFDFPSEIGYRIYKSWADYKTNIIHNFKDIQGGNIRCL